MSDIYETPETEEPVVTEEEVEDFDDLDEDEFSEEEFMSAFEDEDDEEDEEEIEDELDELDPEREDADVEQAGEDDGEQPTEQKPLQERLQENFTQEELNQIYGQARIKSREHEEYIRSIEQMTGMPINEVTQHLQQQKVRDLADETGLPEQEAQRILEDRQARQYLEQQLQNLYQQNTMTRNMAAYQNEKARFKGNPLVMSYEREIDEVSRGGQVLGFEAAMNYVLGQKAVSGDLLNKVKTSSQAKALQNAGRKPKMSPVSAGSGGAQSKSVPKELAYLAKQFGSDPKDIARQYQKMLKEEQDM